MVWTDTDIYSTFTDAALHILGVNHSFIASRNEDIYNCTSGTKCYANFPTIQNVNNYEE